jgi:hypothetical protein
VALVGVMGMPYATLMPVIASKVLHGGPHTLGILMTASGIGALAGTKVIERGIIPWDDGNLAPAAATNVNITSD